MFDPTGLGMEVKEQFCGHNSIRAVYSSVICHVSVRQKMSRLLAVKKLLRIKEDWVMERAFSNAIFIVLGPEWSGGESGWLVGWSETRLLRFVLIMLGFCTVMAGGLREIITGI